MKKLLKLFSMLLIFGFTFLSVGNFNIKATDNDTSDPNNYTEIQTQDIDNPEQFVNIINSCVSTDKNGVYFDSKKALQMGLNDTSINNVINTFNYMNEQIEYGNAEMIINDNGVYDYKETNNLQIINPLATRTDAWWGYQMYFTPSECRTIQYQKESDVAVSAMAAGLSAMLGPEAAPFSVMFIVIGGIKQMDANYFSLCADSNGSYCDYVFDGLYCNWHKA